MYIFLLYSLASAQWSKIHELSYRFATTVSIRLENTILILLISLKIVGQQIYFIVE
jgi:hypothetical protein